METTKEKRCDRLKKIRAYLNLTQEEFGVPLGLNQTKIRDLESGKVKVSTLHAIAIEKIHGINIDWLLTGEGEMFINEGKKGGAEGNIINGIVFENSGVVNNTMNVSKGEEALSLGEGVQMLQKILSSGKKDLIIATLTNLRMASDACEKK